MWAPRSLPRSFVHGLLRLFKGCLMTVQPLPSVSRPSSCQEAVLGHTGLELPAGTVLRGPLVGARTSPQKLQVLSCEDGGRATRKGSSLGGTAGPSCTSEDGWGRGWDSAFIHWRLLHSGLCCTKAGTGPWGFRKRVSGCRVLPGSGTGERNGKGLPELLGGEGPPNPHFLSVSKHSR